jgi:hypothetical protein
MAIQGGGLLLLARVPADASYLVDIFPAFSMVGVGLGFAQVAMQIAALAELRRLRAVERHASREALEEAEIEATLAAHDEWVAAGCPGARSHEDVMAELLGSDQ